MTAVFTPNQQMANLRNAIQLVVLFFNGRQLDSHRVDIPDEGLVWVSASTHEKAFMITDTKGDQRGIFREREIVPFAMTVHQTSKKDGQRLMFYKTRMDKFLAAPRKGTASLEWNEIRKASDWVKVKSQAECLAALNKGK